MSSNKKSLVGLMKQIGYKFNDMKLFHLALTHCSYSIHNNERLELLGDSILNLIITDELYRRLPDKSEGYLTRLRSKLVREDFLVCIAQDFKLGENIYLGKGEKKTGGNMRSSILADAVEALIGAIYIDANFIMVQDRVLRWYQPYLKNIENDTVSKDPKTRLQELLQNKGIKIPEYKLIKIIGKSHAQSFQVSVSISELEKNAVGEGTSKRKAEQAAAKLLLDKLNE